MARKVITVFNKWFRRVSILSKYTYSQYVESFNDIGAFEIHAVLCKDNAYLLDEREIFFVAFNTEDMGRVDTIRKQKEDGENGEIILTGRMLKYKVATSVVWKTNVLNGDTVDIVQDIIKRNMMYGDIGDPKYIPFEFVIPPDRKGLTQWKDKQVTGKSVFEHIHDILAVDNMGFNIRPVISELKEITESQPLTNVTKFRFDIIRGTDHSQGNEGHNRPVIFSHSFSNLERAEVEIDRKEYATVAYVAGEGENADREWIEVYNKDIIGSKLENKGFLRDEIFIDARDLQSEIDEEHKLTAEQYKQTLIDRGVEQLKEHRQSILFEGIIVNKETSFKYKRDFELGDTVTVLDNDVGLRMKAQVTEVTHTTENGEEKLDISIGVQKQTLNNKLKRKGVIY